MANEQQHHYLKIHSALGKDALVLERLTVNEGMSRLFSMDVGFTANERLSDMEGQVGEPVAVSLAMEDGKERFFHGHILCIRELGKPLNNSAAQRYEATLVPRAWSATHRTNCRIFQDKDTMEIVEAVLGEHGVAISKKLNKTPYTYVYCVQYQETDWDFACRLLAHEGFSFFFQHSRSGHTMMVTDNVKAYTPAIESSVVFCTRRVAGQPHISSWYTVFRATANSMIEHGFDFEKPDKVSDSPQEKVPGKKFGKRELFTYIGEDAPLIDSAKLTNFHLQGLTQKSANFLAISDYRSFGVGHTFSFKEHEDKIPGHNEFVITDITLEASVPLNSDDQSGAGRFFYSNSFKCLPTTEVYTPPKLAKPVISGVQTATVCCAPGEEIHVDEHGRIKVQFHWDREGTYDQKSSCWIRVAQSWAGEGWGAQFIPRKDQEVLVDFLTGDPDQPLITGSVYNGANKMPYPPLSDRNLSGFKSRSTTKGGGANYNEIRFDDTKGDELLLVHAEYNHELTVEHDQTDEVGNDRKTEVGNDDLLEVKNNQTVDVTGDQSVSAGKTITVEAGTRLTLKCGAASLVMEASGAISMKGTTLSFQGTTISMKAGKISLN
jgi:type VI secretion system secreted protein VgrG